MRKPQPGSAFDSPSGLRGSIHCLGGRADATTRRFVREACPRPKAARFAICSRPVTAAAPPKPPTPPNRRPPAPSALSQGQKDSLTVQALGLLNEQVQARIVHYKGELETNAELDAITAQVVAQLKAMQASIIVSDGAADAGTAGGRPATRPDRPAAEGVLERLAVHLTHLEAARQAHRQAVLRERAPREEQGRQGQGDLPRRAGRVLRAATLQEPPARRARGLRVHGCRRRQGSLPCWPR